MAFSVNPCWAGYDCGEQGFLSPAFSYSHPVPSALQALPTPSLSWLSWKIPTHLQSKHWSVSNCECLFSDPPTHDSSLLSYLNTPPLHCSKVWHPFAWAQFLSPACWHWRMGTVRLTSLCISTTRRVPGTLSALNKYPFNRLITFYIIFYIFCGNNSSIPCILVA